MDLSYLLRMKFGTAPNEPTASQVRSIALHIKRLHDSGVSVTAAHWAQAVQTNCPSAGQWAYRGVDNSDISTLLALAIKIVDSRDA